MSQGHAAPYRVSLLSRRAGQTGLLVAAAATPYTFQRTLTTRTNADQALVTALTYLITESTATAIQEGLQAFARQGDPLDEPGLRRWGRRAILVDLAAVGAGIGAQRLLRQHPDEPIYRAVGRTTSWMTSVVGAAGALVGIGHGVRPAQTSTRSRGMGATALIAGTVAGLREYSRRQAEGLDEGQGLEPSDISVARSMMLAGAVAIGSGVAGHAEGLLVDRVSRLLAMALPGDESRWRPVGHLAVLGTVVWGGRLAAARVARMIEGKEQKTEPALDVPPLAAELSGAPGSLVTFDTMSRMGRRFVWTARRPEEIERVVGEPARAHPVRAYVGLEAAPTVEERVDLALAELENAGGLQRSWLLLASPTGTGYVNYAAAGALEFLTRGDCATLAMQYSQRPSPLSLDRVKHGRAQFARLVEALTPKLKAIPEDQRPRVVLFGESLGAWTSQDAFLDKGTSGLIEAGIDFAIWIGTPHGSKWKDQVAEGGPTVDPRVVGTFDRIEDLEALSPEARDHLRYVMVTHTNDGVALFGPELLVQQPAWLGPPETRPRKIPRGQRWIPITSFVQTLIDTKNAARVVPGKFEAEGHDYRADIVPFFNAVLRFDERPELLDRMKEALEQEEALRTEWIATHGKVGHGMASVVLAEIRESHPEVFKEAVAAVREKQIGPA